MNFKCLHLIFFSFHSVTLVQPSWTFSFLYYKKMKTFFATKFSCSFLSPFDRQKNFFYPLSLSDRFLMTLTLFIIVVASLPLPLPLFLSLSLFLSFPFFIFHSTIFSPPRRSLYTLSKSKSLIPSNNLLGSLSLFNSWYLKTFFNLLFYI